MIALPDVPLAHASHWLAGLLYLVPVFVLAGGILWQRANDKKARAAGETPEAGDGQGRDLP